MAFINKGKILTGQAAKDKMQKDEAVNTDLTQQEIQFILTKLRQANFKGAEFELFYVVFSKLSNLLKK
ncbi:hypothetical protein N9H35_00980 [bacterium]|nr:hypothetical protein [bacterium]